jgi:aspartyl-tRNA(Asn)/glutamyl-tRNA(Gln) amidotransferase subunit A
MRDGALAQAAHLDEEAKAGKFRSALHGIPIALKDNIDTAGTRTTAASGVFDDRIPDQDAEVVRRLKEAGAVLIGKTNLHEFASGGSSASTYFGPVRNPWALDRIPAGSSGGSAAAVISDLAFGALGTDTGGSVRMPAAYCSIVGLKPTYGLISIRGIIPLTYSLDHCGPMTKTVEDAAIMLNHMTGYDSHDVASVEHVKEAARLRHSSRNSPSPVLRCARRRNRERRRSRHRGVDQAHQEHGGLQSAGHSRLRRPRPWCRTDCLSS